MTPVHATEALSAHTHSVTHETVHGALEPAGHKHIDCVLYSLHLKKSEHITFVNILRSQLI